MEMDRLRSCYRTKMRFVAGGPMYQIRWYWCPPGAKGYPHYHRFASLDWEKDDEVPLLDTGQIGEVPGQPRPYDKGATPPGVTGQSVCGPREWYEFGPPVDAPGLLRRADGVAVCCLPDFRGGLNVGCGAYVAAGDSLAGILWIYWPDRGAEVVFVYRDGVSGVSIGGENV